MYGLTRVDRLIIELARDNVSGASDLVRKAVDIFVAMADDYKGNMDLYFETLVDIGKKVMMAQPSMAPMFNCVNDLLVTLDEVAKSLLREFTKNWGKAYLEELGKARSWVIKNGTKIIAPGDTLMTYSHSSAVLGLLEECQGKNIEVYVSEGRPINEGVSLAQTLGRRGIQTTLVVDAALPMYMKRVDKVIVGADAITEKGVVNKIGTRGLAMVAKTENVPFYIAAERNKFVLSGFFTPKFTEHSPLEITHMRMKNVKVRNIYFDETPLDLVTGVITEEGVKTPDETMSYLKGRKICSALLVDDMDHA
jgi:translation initiation factor 2B subunit (eIF-2B alpha/beta/delta family)